MQQFFQFPVTPCFSFDSFVPCEGNIAALRFALRIADPADPESLLYLYGPSGSGKTHLLRSIAGSNYPYLSLRDHLDPERLVSTFSAASGLVMMLTETVAIPEFTTPSDICQVKLSVPVDPPVGV